jgi:processive 1,2-diacylglycerol beta-glucosyltransferase
VHAMWLCRTFHRYFVALEESKVHLQVLGLPEHNITVSGIPIDPLFAKKEDPVALRIEAGLDPHRPLFLISAGALGVSPAAGVLEGLSRLKHPAQAVVICGRNEDLKADLEKQAAAIEASAPGLNFRVIGYTDEMHRWMQMSDLFIGKPGGLTTAECLASGLPMMIVEPIPGQEERNSDHLLEKGVALKCNEFTTLAYKIDNLLDDPATFKAMREKALALGRPGAAETIVDTLLIHQADAAAQIGPERTTPAAGG